MAEAIARAESRQIGVVHFVISTGANTVERAGKIRGPEPPTSDPAIERLTHGERAPGKVWWEGDVPWHPHTMHEPRAVGVPLCTGRPNRPSCRKRNHPPSFG